MTLKQSPFLMLVLMMGFSGDAVQGARALPDAPRGSLVLYDTEGGASAVSVSRSFEDERNLTNVAAVEAFFESLAKKDPQQAGALAELPADGLFELDPMIVEANPALMIEQLRRILAAGGNLPEAEGADIFHFLRLTYLYMNGDLDRVLTNKVDVVGLSKVTVDLCQKYPEKGKEKNIAGDTALQVALYNYASLLFHFATNKEEYSEALRFYMMSERPQAYIVLANEMNPKPYLCIFAPTDIQNGRGLFFYGLIDERASRYSDAAFYFRNALEKEDVRGTPFERNILWRLARFIYEGWIVENEEGKRFSPDKASYQALRLIARSGTFGAAILYAQMLIEGRTVFHANGESLGEQRKLTLIRNILKAIGQNISSFVCDTHALSDMDSITLYFNNQFRRLYGLGLSGTVLNGFTKLLENGPPPTAAVLSPGGAGVSVGESSASIAGRSGMTEGPAGAGGPGHGSVGTPPLAGAAGPGGGASGRAAPFSLSGSLKGSPGPVPAPLGGRALDPYPSLTLVPASAVSGGGRPQASATAATTPALEVLLPSAGTTVPTLRPGAMPTSTRAPGPLSDKEIADVLSRLRAVVVDGSKYPVSARLHAFLVREGAIETMKSKPDNDFTKKLFCKGETVDGLKYDTLFTDLHATEKILQERQRGKTSGGSAAPASASPASAPPPHLTMAEQVRQQLGMPLAPAPAASVGAPVAVSTPKAAPALPMGMAEQVRRHLGIQSAPPVDEDAGWVTAGARPTPKRSTASVASEILTGTIERGKGVKGKDLFFINGKVFVSPSDLGGAGVGDFVSYELITDYRGRPQAGSIKVVRR